MLSAEPSLKRADTLQLDADQDAVVNHRKRTLELEIEMETVTDEEVEEFCAILRRLKRPVKYFSGKVKRWQPSFVAEDFNVDADEGCKAANGNVKLVNGEEELDLNADPLASE